MKAFAVFAALAALALVAYKIHNDALLRSRPTPPAKAPALKAVAISRLIEPLYADLLSDLNQARPADLAPPIDVTKQRILDKKAHAEEEKQQVYAIGARLLDSMHAFAEERTKTLQALLETTAAKGRLDAPGTLTPSGAFFAQSTIKRWEEEKKRRKPGLDQLLAQLRTAEREWNKRAGENARVDTYDLPALEPVYITVDNLPVAANPLEKRAYDGRRVVYPWRTNYYNRYGYPAAP